MQGARCRAVERLGGTRADVWLGVVAGLNGFRRPVVLKRAPVSDPDGVRDLFREASIAMRLTHPNVVAALDLFEAPRELVLALEHVLGVDARELARPAPWPVAARIVCDAARGLDYVHELRDGHGRALRIVHGDVSIANLVISELGYTKVTDFGIARTATDTARQDVVHGTRGFLSPEQARGEAIDARSDVFALGQVFVHLAMSRGAFDSTFVGAAARAASLEAPPAVTELLKRMLAVEPARRPRMRDVVDLLDPVAAQSGGDQRAVAQFVRSGSLERLEARRRALANAIEPPAGALFPLAHEGPEEVSLTGLDEVGEPTEVDRG
ncbi:MAG: serine/threonine-protein kinase [Sandaracinaceae bacterium]